MKSGDFLAEIVAATFMNVPSILIVLYLSLKPDFNEIYYNVVLVT